MYCIFLMEMQLINTPNMYTWNYFCLSDGLTKYGTNQMEKNINQRETKIINKVA